MKKRPLNDRFWEKVKKTKTCWLWIGGKNSDGYGSISVNTEKRSVRSHRISWEFVNGKIAKGMNVLHKCDVRNCVNPDHLFLGTCKINSLDMVNKNRQAKGDFNGNSKLKNKDIKYIRSQEKYRGLITTLSKKYKVDRHTITRIIKYKSWKQQ